MSKIQRLYRNTPVGATGSAADIIYPVTVADAILYSTGSSGGQSAGNTQTLQQVVSMDTQQIAALELKISSIPRLFSTNGTYPDIDTENGTITFNSGSAFSLNGATKTITNAGQAVSLFTSGSPVAYDVPFYLVFSAATGNILSMPVTSTLGENQYIIGISSRNSSLKFIYGKYSFDYTKNGEPMDFDPYTITRKWVNDIEIDACFKELWLDDNYTFIATASIIKLTRIYNDYMGYYSIAFSVTDSSSNTTVVENQSINPTEGVTPLYRTSDGKLVGYCVIDWTMAPTYFYSSNGLILRLNPLILRNSPIIATHLRANGYKDWTLSRNLNSYIREFYFGEATTSTYYYKFTKFYYDSVNQKVVVEIAEYNGSSLVNTLTDSDVTVGELYKFQNNDIYVYISPELVDSGFYLNTGTGDTPISININTATDPLNSPVAYTYSLLNQ